MEHYINAFKKYAVFNGRTSRKEFWMFVLFNIIFSVAAVILDNILGLSSDSGYGIFSGLYSLVMILPALGAEIRRLHDIGKSGWWIFISLVPLIGAIWLLVLLAKEGDPGDNAYGPEPITTL
jgi:uncharacterized membrane protein YhaH (DUF805 family)